MSDKYTVNNVCERLKNILNKIKLEEDKNLLLNKLSKIYKGNELTFKLKQKNWKRTIYETDVLLFKNKYEVKAIVEIIWRPWAVSPHWKVQYYFAYKRDGRWYITDSVKYVNLFKEDGKTKKDANRIAEMFMIEASLNDFQKYKEMFLT